MNKYNNADAGKYFVIGGVGGEAVGKENMLLIRVVARGPKMSIFAPKTCMPRTGDGRGRGSGQRVVV